jgi:hypothetical protein
MERESKGGVFQVDVFLLRISLLEVQPTGAFVLTCWVFINYKNADFSDKTAHLQTRRDCVFCNCDCI